MGLVGVLAFLALAVGLSRDRKSIHWRTVGWALALQWIFAVVVLKGYWLSYGLRFIPFPKGTGWGVLALMFVPMALRRFGKFEDKRLNWTVFGLVVLGLLRGNLVGGAFDRMRVVVNHLMEFATDGATFVFGDLAKGSGAPVTL